MSDKNAKPSISLDFVPLFLNDIFFNTFPQFLWRPDISLLNGRS